jgi:hypothetical protein
VARASAGGQPQAEVPAQIHSRGAGEVCEAVMVEFSSESDDLHLSGHG